VVGKLEFKSGIKGSSPSGRDTVFYKLKLCSNSKVKGHISIHIKPRDHPNKPCRI